MTDRIRRFTAWAWIPTLIYAATRSLSLMMMAVALRGQPAIDPEDAGNPFFAYSPTPPSPNVLEGAINWDGQWYWSIAESGYPETLPRADGQVQQNEWAFFPLYPLIVRGVMGLTSASFPVASPIISLALGWVATLLIYRLILEAGGRFVAATAVLGLNVSPTSPVFQVAYSESLALLLIAVSLWALRRRSVGLLLTSGILLALSRPIAPALAVAALVIAFVPSSTRRPWIREQPLPVLGAIATIGLSSALWPTIAAIGTGEVNAFSSTQAAWPTNQGALGLWGNWIVGPLLMEAWHILAFSALLLMFLVLLIVRPQSSLWGTELRVWTLAYPAVILLTSRPSTSIFRYLILAITPYWPLVQTWDREGSRAQRVLRLVVPILLVVAFLFLQWRWLTDVYVIGTDPKNHP